MAQVGAQTFDSVRMQPGLSLTYGKDRQFLNVVSTALGIRVKVTHGIQLVAEEFGTDRPVGGRRKDIHNAAPDRKLAGTFHHAAPAVTGGGKLIQQPVQRVFLSGFQAEGGLHQCGSGHGPLG